jgi:peptide/nickel transport system permease protein
VNKKIMFTRMRHSYFFMTGLTCLVIILIAIYIVPLFLEWDPNVNALLDRFSPPDGFSKGLKGHILGTDELGRDVLTRLLIGGQYSIQLAFVSIVLITVIGSALGVVSGYFGGLIDVVVMRLCETVLAIPPLIMAIAIISVLGQSTKNLIMVMVLGGWVQITKITRNQVRVIKQQEFVLASKALGAKGFHIMFGQILPNVTTQIIVLTSQRIGVLILLEASLSYLNLGIPLPSPSWGNMISSGRMYLVTHPWMILAPGFALMLGVLAFNFMGDGIRDVLDTKRKV